MSTTVTATTQRDADAVELRFVISATRRLLERINFTGAGPGALTAVESLIDDLDAIAMHPTNTMADVVVVNLDRIANPHARTEGMTVGEALASLAKIGFYDPARLVPPYDGDATQRAIDAADGHMDSRPDVDVESERGAA